VDSCLSLSRLKSLSNDAVMIRILAASGSSNDPALKEALLEYGKQLAAEQDELNEQISSLESKLDRYRKSGKGMDQIVERYVELDSKKKELQQQIQRLQTRS
jgi:chromosome segregation ATPase